MKDSAESRKELELEILKLAMKDQEDVFFESCALRMKKMDPQTKSYLQLQISTLFCNAENQDRPPIPISPLPQKLFMPQNVYSHSIETPSLWNLTERLSTSTSSTSGPNMSTTDITGSALYDTDN